MIYEHHDEKITQYREISYPFLVYMRFDDNIFRTTKAGIDDVLALDDRVVNSFM